MKKRPTRKATATRRGVVVSGDNRDGIINTGDNVVINASGATKVQIDVLLMMQKRLVLSGSTLRPRSVAQKAEIATAVLHAVWPLLAAGRVRPVIHSTFPLAAAAAAHELMETSTHIGKIMLTM